MADETVACAVCGQRMACINNRHLARHGLTAEQYRARFPDAPMRTDAVADRLSERSRRSNAPRKGVARSEQDRAAMRAGHARRPSRKGIGTGPKSLETRRKLSDAAKARYEERGSPLAGIPKSAEHRYKISVSLSGRSVPPDVTRKVIDTKRQRGFDFAFMRGRLFTAEHRANIARATSERFARQREARRAPMRPRIEAANLRLLNQITEDVFQLVCNTCGHEFTRTPQNFQPSKFSPEICDQCFPIWSVSAAETELGAFVAGLPSVGRIVASDREQIAPFALDLFLPAQRLAIEYCGLYWHSEDAGRPRFYHRRKLEACEEKGVRLLTVFEDEWLNKRPIVESLITNALHLSTNKINARDCSVREIDAAEASAFLNIAHIQGRGRSKRKFGLFKDDTLVACMTFSDSEVSRRQTGWEINRFAVRPGCSVRGGASRLFRAFVRATHPDAVTSYADLRWGTGAVYAHLGFEMVGRTVPNYWYVRPNEVVRHHRYALRKTPSDPADISEREVRAAQGWNRIWDCGHAKWVWTSP